MLLPVVQAAGWEGARLEERNIMGELNMYRQLGLKPNFSEIGKRYASTGTRSRDIGGKAATWTTADAIAPAASTRTAI